MLKILLTEVFECRLDAEAHALVRVFPNMVRWWFGKAEAFKGGSFAAFRNQFYEAWKLDWKGYNSQNAQTSCIVAYSDSQLSKAPEQRVRKAALNWDFAVVSPKNAKIVGCEFVFPTKRSKHAHVELITENPRQKTLLEQAMNMHWQVGQSILTAEWCIVPFVRYRDLSAEKDRVLNELLMAKANTTCKN